MLNQVGWDGAESAVLFGAVAVAMEVAYSRGWVDQFE
jgi:hypothetical protein